MSLTFVQAAATGQTGSASHPVSNWASPPTNGNLLLAFGYIHNSTSPSPANGWKLTGFGFKSTTNWFMPVYYKYASSAPQIENIDTNTFVEWSLTFWEISGVSGKIWKDLVNVTFPVGQASIPSSPVAIGSLTTTAFTTLVLAGYTGLYQTAGGTIAAGGTGFTSDVNLVETGTNSFSFFQFAAGAHQTVTPGATVASTAAVAPTGGSGAWGGAYLELGDAPIGPDGPVSTGGASGTVGAGGNLNANLSVTSETANSIIIVVFMFQGGGPTGTQTPQVTASGLTFAQRADIVASASGCYIFWAAAATPLAGATVNAEVTCAGAPGSSSMAMLAFAVGGPNPLTPWDPNGGLPVTETSPPATSPTAYSTSGSPDWVLGIPFSGTSTPPPTPPGFTSIGTAIGVNFGVNCSFNATFEFQASPTTGSVTWGPGTTANFLYVDGLLTAASFSTAVGSSAGAGHAAGIGSVLSPSVGFAAGVGAAESHATGIVPAVGIANGLADVVGVGNVLGVLEPLFDWEATVISQYQTSPTLLQLIQNMETYVDPLTNLDNFYVDMWNIYSASGYGLDVWGRIVGVTRVVRVPTPTAFLGFEQAAPGVKPYDFGILFDGSQALTENFSLADDAFRTLILAKALANICNGSIPAMNQILINLFNGKGYGNVYVTDGEDMTMTITFTNAPSPVDLAIISTSGVFPRPAGVLLSVVT